MERDALPPGLGADLSSEGRITPLNGTWSVVSNGPDHHLHCVLRRRPRGRIDLLDTGGPIAAVAVREGRVPVPRYRADSWWRRRRRGRWLVFASSHGPRVSVVSFQGPEPDPGRYDGTWPNLYGTDAQRLARALRSVTTPLAEQLAECDYRSIARSANGLFEIYENARSPGLPTVCRAADKWSLLRTGSELWRWDPTLTAPTDGPDTETRRSRAPEVREWLIPAGPVGPYRGELRELRAYHRRTVGPEEGGRMGADFHRWEHPRSHFHHGPFMIAAELECARLHRDNRDWHGSLRSLKWRETKEWEVEP